MTYNNIVRELKLHSPAGVEPAVFTWPNIERQKTKKDTVFIGGDEIVRTIRLVFEDYPVLYQQNLGLDNCDIHSYSKMKELCDKFNKIIDTHVKLNRGTEAFSARLQQRPTAKLFRHILAQVYSRSVTDPDKLRDYEPFSPSVYGETSPDLIDSILKIINLTEDQTFIDLGSGVGNVVLHVAALANCKNVYGIEHEETPATYARAMAEEFRFWMRWYGKRYSEFQLEQGDFLIHPKIDERIKEADVIFANNYVFGSTVNHELKVKFMNMKDGAKIVSSREFCSETFRLNDRTKNDLGAVMHVTKPEEFLGKVSWSDKCVQYYLHVIDHSKLALYYEKMHQIHTKGSKTNHLKHNDDDQSPSSNNSSIQYSSIIKNNQHNKTFKIDENQPPTNHSKHSKRKRKIKSSISTSSPSNSSTIISARGRKIHLKHQSDNESEFDSDESDDELINSKHRRSSYKDYQLTLNELHTASEKYIQLNQNFQIKNQQFNYQNMTNLSNDNLHINHFHDCLLEQNDQQLFNSINSYLEQFRQRLIKYFTYMKSNIYREHLKNQLDNEMELNKTLKMKVNCLENNIKTLLEDAINLLKLRTHELGIEELERPVQLITYANDISNKHKELRTKVATLEKEIAEYNYENDKINFFLNNVLTNGHQSTTTTITTEQSLNDNIYSTLLVNMSRQTQQQQQENKPQLNHIDYLNKSLTKTNQLSCLPISPNTSIDNDLDLNSKINQNTSPLYNVVKSERKTDFIIQKRAKKLSTPNSDGHAIVSPIKIIKVTDKRNELPESLIRPSLLSSNILIKTNNLLSTKQIEPVQVHSVISKLEHQTKEDKLLQQSIIQSTNVEAVINTSVSSSNTKISSSNKADDISQEMIIQSPRKKRDFYGKSSGTPTSSSSSSSSNKSYRHMNKIDSFSSNKNRPSSTPACTEVLPTTILPDRPISIPPLRTSSYV
ncbi:unnamed protein product [Rotaria sp. Silwood1]|nr:unnamed protein product [Rotaria sp. Silwood1]CAF1478811.1 unnamed protein product [Rotaria sp. Silwood1]CAF3614139.1 unnamed protein product [Rotaria sp. Silwood1]CAF3614319.1 unnamed protein product [Rotaria sp. Silwood1]CAF4692600.1 unnamed protein product [Rotaria sp. Silwood1]